MTIKIGDRVRVRSTYYSDAYHGQEGVIYLRNDRDFYYFKSEEVVLSFPVGTAFGFEAKHLEVIPHKPKTLADYTDQELADEWRAYAEKIHHIRKEIKDRGFTTQYRKADAAETAPWNTQTPVADPGTYNYRIFKSETVVTETAL